MYYVSRSEVDKKGIVKKREAFERHAKYHDACEELRNRLGKEVMQLFKIKDEDVYTRDGNLRSTSPYFKDEYTEYTPYAWMIRLGNKGTIAYSVNFEP